MSAPAFGLHTSYILDDPTPPGRKGPDDQFVVSADCARMMRNEGMPIDGALNSYVDAGLCVRWAYILWDALVIKDGSKLARRDPVYDLGATYHKLEADPVLRGAMFALWAISGWEGTRAFARLHAIPIAPEVARRRKAAMVKGSK